MAARTASPASKRRVKRRTTIHTFTWRHAALRVVETENVFEAGWTQLELTVVKPKKAPLPLTDTGYFCHYLDAETLARAGGPVQLFTDWLDREAATRKWRDTEFRWRQFDLFARAKR